MRLKIFILCLVALFVSQTSRAQWVVTDPGNLAQGIINATKNIVHTSSTASTMIQNFQETVKIYKQGKEYYDALKKVKNLVRDARKVQLSETKPPSRFWSKTRQGVRETWKGTPQ